MLRNPWFIVAKFDSDIYNLRGRNHSEFEIFPDNLRWRLLRSSRVFVLWLTLFGHRDENSVSNRRIHFSMSVMEKQQFHL